MPMGRAASKTCMVTKENVRPGMRVMRGKDWRWDNQDKGQHFRGSARVLTGRVHFSMNERAKYLSPIPKFEMCITFLAQKSSFSEWPRATSERFLVKKGAVHLILKIDPLHP